MSPAPEPTLTDAGPLVALIDRGETSHERCRAVVDELVGPMLTTWPALTEAMYLLGAAAGWRAQSALWRIVLDGDLRVDATAEDRGLRRMQQLMERYRDTPMDLADASLVELAERRGLRRLFTLDRHFAAYRMARRRGFELLP